MKKRILVVDDDRTLLELLRAHLQRHDYDVVVAENGATALRMAYQSHPDLIILDVMMPEMSGIEVCKRLREMSNTPIIMLTALSQENYVIKALDAGADDYVRKPYTIGELLARIKVQFRAEKQGAENEPPAQLVAGEVQIDLPKRKVSVREPRGFDANGVRSACLHGAPPRRGAHPRTPVARRMGAGICRSTGLFAALHSLPTQQDRIQPIAARDNQDRARDWLLHEHFHNHLELIANEGAWIEKPNTDRKGGSMGHPPLFCTTLLHPNRVPIVVRRVDQEAWV
ncbi:MAG: response regulator transcription factor [Caldilineaceae bacterium]